MVLSFLIVMLYNYGIAIVLNEKVSSAQLSVITDMEVVCPLQEDIPLKIDT